MGLVGLKKDYMGAGEVTQWLGALTAFAEELGSITHIHISVNNHSELQFQGNLALISDLKHYVTRVTYLHADNILRYKNTIF